MSSGMDIAFFASSLVSAYWNGAATYYRGVVRALAERGHRVRFFEPDAYERQQHRDIDDPPWATVVVYPAEESAARRALQDARGADLVVKASGVGVFDEMLERGVLDLQGPCTRVAFWDVDAPATLERVQRDTVDPFRTLIPEYDIIFTYGGGQPVVDAYRALGARSCVPVYNGLDPTTHHPEPADPRFAGDLSFLGNRLPDREARVEEFFLEPALSLPQRHFVLGGNGWGSRELPPNVSWVGHVFTRDHNAFNASATAVLNINRDSMARYGFSPATRVFEAAGAGACVITDAFAGVEEFFEPGREILVVKNGAELTSLLAELDAERARIIGAAARARVLSQHTYAQRVVLVEKALEAGRTAEQQQRSPAGARA